jgi:photosystem II stability/assembly factor-like uncharacterized protein
MRRSTRRNRFATTLLLLLTATLTTKKIQAQFDIEDSNTTASLRGIHNVGGGVAWASGTNGTVLRTEDGGYLWQTCTIPPGAEKLDFRGIQAFDENTAIVMSSGKGDLSRLYKTTDGCQTWHPLFTNPDKEGFWDAIQMAAYRPFDEAMAAPKRISLRRGVLIGDPVNGTFSIFVTQNGGDTWQRWNEDDAKHPPKATAKESLFAASNQAIVAPGSNGDFAFVTGGNDSRIYQEQKHDPFDLGGWDSLSYRSLGFPSSNTAGAFAIAARPDPKSTYSDLMVVGGDYEMPDLPGHAAFVPGIPRFLLGNRAIEGSKQPPHGYRSSVAYDPIQKLWITVGPNGTDISTDDGKNWRSLTPSGYDPPDADKNWNALSLPFVVGPHGRIGRLRTIPNPTK